MPTSTNSDQNEQHAAMWRWAAMDVRTSPPRVVNRFRTYSHAALWAESNYLCVAELPTVRSDDIY